ncbi:NACHT domain-containing protein [Allosalinactinospora lopnorensis]|uniref:NACHT domain-containing protein n=1 Tax=Allosalinactinospora lopnorensis TaxID=1352348 RepID=UPI000698B3F9|nr:ATP-binding protein [Allosalinactinospora lopnorensis]
MAKKFGYADALKVLGKDDSAVLDLAEKLLDGGLGAVGVPDLFGLRGELVAKGRGLLTGIRERISGVSRWDRTERIDAAYRILLTVSLLEALDETLDDPDTPDLTELGITEEELTLLVGQMLNAGTHPPLALSDTSAFGAPEPDGAPHNALRLVRPLGRLPESYSNRSPQLGRFTEVVTEKAQRRFQESYRRLAADVPEFGVWVDLAEHQATRSDLATGFSGLEDLLVQLSPAAKAHQHVRELNTLYRRTLRRPLLSTLDTPDHLTFPTLEEAYIHPRGRVRPAHRDCRPASEDWWHEAAPHEDLQRLLAGLLTQTSCATHPIVILGHPGAGKSKLTEMLAARLPAQDFLPVRVELRGVNADAPVRKQIEEGISGQLHRDVAWRDLVEAAAGAQPVVILDGFDELLQATGANRSDYLEQVQQFQEDQAALGQPVAVIVTSRTVVADRIRFPPGCVLVRLEPFSANQIVRMLDIWNSANSGTLASRGLAPLSPEAVLAYRELAEQPLLLLMLLLYDADGNALQSGGTLSRSELYERMLAMFARREVAKHHPNLSDRETESAVEHELRRLEIAAMAMFARHRQSVAAEELDRDLAALLPEPAARPAETGLHGTVSDAHQVLGRFFFIHESRARHGGRTAGVYEFLHATFAEFLVARMVASTLDELAADRQHAVRRRFASPLDDGLLYAVTSFALLCSRSAIVEFTGELLRQRFTEEPTALDEYRTLLIELFHDAPFPQPNRSFSDYAPWRAPITTRQANYTANLVVLLVCVCEELDLAELFPGEHAPWRRWLLLANQWRSIAGDAWHGLLNTIRTRHLGFWEGEGHTRIEREHGEPVNIGECLGFEVHKDITGETSVTNPYDTTVPFGSVTSTLLRSTALRANGTAARVFLTLGPYVRHVSTDLLTWYSDPDDPDAAWNELHDVLELRLAPAAHDMSNRLFRYHRLLHSRQLGRLELLVLRQAAEDLGQTNHRNHGALVVYVSNYLYELESVVPGPRLSREEVTPVLDAIRPYLSIPDDRIDRLLDDHDRLEGSASAPPIPSRARTQHKEGGNQSPAGSGGR